MEGSEWAAVHGGIHLIKMKNRQFSYMRSHAQLLFFRSLLLFWVKAFLLLFQRLRMRLYKIHTQYVYIIYTHSDTQSIISTNFQFFLDGKKRERQFVSFDDGMIEILQIVSVKKCFVFSDFFLTPNTD